MKLLPPEPTYEMLRALAGDPPLLAASDEAELRKRYQAMRDSAPEYVQGEATVPLRLVNALIESLEPAIHYEGVLLTLSLRDRQAVRKAIADVRATISGGD